MLYLKRHPSVEELDTTPDPLFNPNEVTRVKDILDLHSRGISVPMAGKLRGEQTDERSDFAKMQGPNYESDKLYPRLPLVVQQNAHYSSVLNDEREEFQQEIEYNDALSKAKNNVSRGTNQVQSTGSQSVTSTSASASEPK